MFEILSTLSLREVQSAILKQYIFFLGSLVDGILLSKSTITALWSLSPVRMTDIDKMGYEA